MKTAVFDNTPPHMLVDWTHVPKTTCDWEKHLLADKNLLSILGAEKLVVLYPYYCKEGWGRDYLKVFGFYPKKGWYQVFDFSIKKFPGCCGIALIHDLQLSSFVYQLLNFNEIESLLTALVEFYESSSKQLGYTQIMATEITADVNWAAKEHNAYTKAGWKPLTKFNNKRTNNEVTVLMKEL